MKKILFLILLFPTFLFAQNQKLPYWFKEIRVGLAYNFDYVIGLNDNGNTDFGGNTIFALEFDNYQSNSALAFMEIRFTPNFGVKTGLGFGTGIINTFIRENDLFSPTGTGEASFIHRAKFSTISIPFKINFSKDWNKARLYGGIGMLLQSSFNMQQETIQVAGTSPGFFFFNENTSHQNYGLMGSIGYFIAHSKKLQFFVEPNILFNLNKTQFGRWKKRLFNFGITLGASFKAK